MRRIAELFVFKSAAIKADLERVANEQNLVKAASDVERATDALIAPHLSGIDYPIQAAAERMAEFYKIFYMLENDMRQFVASVLEELYGSEWWTKKVPADVQRYAKSNKEKESREGLPPRSKSPLDYLSFGHLSEVIKYNWDVFAGLFPNCEVERLEKVANRLNMARGPIAHCGYLPEDEVVRLKLAIRDWYSLSE